MTVKKTYSATKYFDRNAFKNRLNSIPQHILIEMAHDGVIDENEVRRLLVLLGVTTAEADAMRSQFRLIGETVLRYVERKEKRDAHRGVCSISGEQAAEIMKGLLERGIIGRYYEKVVAPQLPEGMSEADRPTE